MFARSLSETVTEMLTGPAGTLLFALHGWRALRRRLAGGREPPSTLLGRRLGHLLTFTVVVVAWVPFRAESFDAALAILAGMAGLFLTVSIRSFSERLE